MMMLAALLHPPTSRGKVQCGMYNRTITRKISKLVASKTLTLFGLERREKSIDSERVILWTEWALSKWSMGVFIVTRNFFDFTLRSDNIDAGFDERVSYLRITYLGQKTVCKTPCLNSHGPYGPGKLRSKHQHVTGLTSVFVLFQICSIVTKHLNKISNHRCPIAATSILKNDQKFLCSRARQSVYKVAHKPRISINMQLICMLPQSYDIVLTIHHPVISAFRQKLWAHVQAHVMK